MLRKQGSLYCEPSAVCDARVPNAIIGQSVYTARDNMTITCSVGFVISDAEKSVVQCGLLGRWNMTLPRCLPLVQMVYANAGSVTSDTVWTWGYQQLLDNDLESCALLSVPQTIKVNTGRSSSLTLIGDLDLGCIDILDKVMVYSMDRYCLASDCSRRQCVLKLSQPATNACSFKCDTALAFLVSVLSSSEFHLCEIST